MAHHLGFNLLYFIRFLTRYPVKKKQNFQKAKICQNIQSFFQKKIVFKIIFSMQNVSAHYAENIFAMILRLFFSRESFYGVHFFTE